MKHFFFILTICFGILQAYAVKVTDPVDYVNPLMGTQSKFELSNGNTYPAIALPWGMNFWTPQTGKMGNGWVYTYDADKIRGFKQTHQPSPWINDYGQFSIMPLTGELVFDEEERASWFSHKAETVKPYYYSVYLADHDVVTEIVPTERAAMFRFTFPENDDSYIIMDAFDKGSEVKIFPEENKIMGYTTKNNGGVPDNFKNYFVVQFDKPFTYKASVLNKKIMPDVPGIRGDHTGAIIGFSTKKGEKIHAKVTSSFISYEQAEQNFRELNNDFDGLKDAARQTWNDILGRILIEDDNLDNIRTFYSTLYRSVLFPRKLYEIDPSGNIVHYSPYNGKIEKGYMFTDTGFWDTFRCLFPFLNLMYPSMNEQMQEGLVNTYKESGFLPEWASPGHRSCMVGNNSASVVADAYLKGLKGYDINILYEAVLHGTQNVHPKVKSTGRYGHEYYNELGYVPYDVKINENVARTLEYAYSDWAIYKLAKALSRPQSEIDLFAQRAMNYKNVFDAETKLMRGRNKDGSFQSPFNPLKWGDAFTEGNSWHYTWSVFHDPQGLIDLMGGKSVFNQMLDSIFNIPPLFDDSYYGKVIHEIREMQIMNMGNYAHGNQPIQHMIYLYNYSGEPWKAQYRTREVMNKLYSATPDGYCGDEDNGQTSAWYVFSALGFYPVCPGTDEYIVGSPLFKKATLYLENGKEMVLSSHNNHSSCPYINVLKVNGMEHTQNYFRHDQLTEGGNIDFYMSDKPNKQRGIEDKDLPYSFSREKDYTTKLKAITFNIRMDTPSDGVNSWSHRKENVIGMLKRMNGDVMGMQEVLFNQLQDLQNNLPGYSYIGVGRVDGKQEGEFSPVFYKKDRFILEDSGNFWLSEDPSAVGKKGWDAACERIASWGILKDKQSDREIFVLSTHFDHVGTVARKESALLLLSKIKELANGLPCIIMGDFNDLPQSEAILSLTTGTLKDSKVASKYVLMNEGTFHNYGKIAKEERSLIDYIFLSSCMDVFSYTVLPEKNEKGYYSDHSPVEVNICIP